MLHFVSFFLKFKFNFLVKRFFLLLNTDFALAILDLISHVHLPSFVNMLPKYLPYIFLNNLYSIFKESSTTVYGREVIHN